MKQTTTLTQIHKDLIELKGEIRDIKMFIKEDFELSDEVTKEIEESRKRPKEDFISHEEMKKEFG